MKTNLELARAVLAKVSLPEGEPGLLLFPFNRERINAFAALVEQRYRERLLGENVEPVAIYMYHPSTSGWLKTLAGETILLPHGTAIYTAEQCAAMVQQAMPKRLTEIQVEYISKNISKQRGGMWMLDLLFADAIQDALGIKE